MGEFDPHLLYWARQFASLISEHPKPRRVALRRKFEELADDLEGIQGRTRLEAERKNGRRARSTTKNGCDTGKANRD